MRIPKRRSQILKQEDSSSVVYLTKNGFKRLQNQLTKLKQELPQAVEDMQHALSLGDYSENSEYQDAKHRLSRLHARIFCIQDKLHRAVEVCSSSEGVIAIGSTVVLRKKEKEFIYHLVGPQESNPSHGRISYLSPLGRALLGHLPGETIAVDSPQGDVKYLIIKIR